MSRPAKLASVILMVMQNRHMHEGIAHTAQGMTLAGRVLIGLWTDLLAERVSQCTKDMIRGSNNWRATDSAADARLSSTGKSFCMVVWNCVGGASKSASFEPSGRRAFTPAQLRDKFDELLNAQHCGWAVWNSEVGAHAILNEMDQCTHA